MIVVGLGGGNFGYSMSSVGDVNGDGIDDFLVGAPHDNNKVGAAYIIFGSESYYMGQDTDDMPYYSDDTTYGNYYFNGVDDDTIYYGTDLAITNFTIVRISTLIAAQGVILNGESAYLGRFGWSVSGLGDVNGDGFDDIVIGAPYARSKTGTSYVIFGGSYLSSVGTLNMDALSASEGIFVYGDAAGDQSGTSVGQPNDFNGDGYNDILIGAPYASNDAGIA